MADKLLFLRSGFNSHTNQAVRLQLERHFPDLELIDHDIQQALSAQLYGTQAKLQLLLEYGPDFLLRRKSRYSWKDWIEVTSWAFQNALFRTTFAAAIVFVSTSMVVVLVLFILVSFRF